MIASTSSSPMRGAWDFRGQVAAAGFGDTGRAAAAGEDFQSSRIRGPRAASGVHAGEQAADAVADPGCLAGQVVVEPDQHLTPAHRQAGQVKPLGGQLGD
jgi:hypothetical protein